MAYQQKQSRKADKREGAHDQRTRANLRQVLKPRSLHTSAPSGHAKRQTTSPKPAPTLHPHFKNILGFCLFRSPKLRGVDKNNQEKIHFCPFLPLIRCLFVLVEWWRGLEVPCVNECRLICGESLQKEPPPPIWGAKTPFTPIIFRTIKIEKSSPKRT